MGKHFDVAIFLARCVGIVLIIAATFKIISLATEPVVWKDFQTSHFFDSLLSLVEIVIGALLVASVSPKHSIIAATLLFICFAGYSAYSTIVGSRTCECLGKIEVSPIVVFCFDVVIVAVLAGCFRSICHSPPRHSAPPIRASIVFASIISLFCVAIIGSTYWWRPLMHLSVGNNGLESIYAHGDFVAIDPVKLVGQRFDLTEYIKGGKEILRDDWIVVFSRRSCEECQNLKRFLTANPDHFQINVPNRNTQVAFLEASQIANTYFSANKEFAVKEYFLDASYRWVVETPSAVYVSNGIVVKTIDIESLFKGKEL